MTTLIFRCDSTDLFRGQRVSDPNAPRMMKIEAVLITRKDKLLCPMAMLIHPSGWVPNAGAAAAHGITVRECELYGVRAKAALACFMDMVRNAAEIAAWSLPFHRGIVDVELHRLDVRQEEWMRAGLKRRCLMQEAGMKWNGGRNLSIEAAAQNTFEGWHGDKMQSSIDIFRALRDG